MTCALVHDKSMGSDLDASVSLGFDEDAGKGLGFGLDNSEGMGFADLDADLDLMKSSNSKTSSSLYWSLSQCKSSVRYS